ncbi:VOC family protein [Agrococcus baldri]|uniref:VOC domain-containing protein n=1 Tax=Agrococcus baldri TaxID=153730 RepID=A0AA87RIH1_9MICO|nr:VOC family protein [Agrococcus baldri]GEK78792.1 hypothetical protein ABA31_01430 [Agrococcus baldri]
MIRRVLAHCTVTDLDRAEDWYTRLFDRAPDARPMPGLIEWHLGDTFGVQVWSEPERAGHSSVVLDETDLDAAAAHASEAGIDHDGPQAGAGARILQLTDPDGNRIVITGA